MTSVTALAVASLVAGVAATAASIGGQAEAGVDAPGVGQTVTSVSSTGFAWREGVRPGQTIMRIEDSLSAGGWLIETAEGSTRFVARATPYDQALGGALPFGIAAMVSGGFAIVFIRGHRAWVTAAACAGLLLATPALSLQGKPEASTVTMAMAAITPILWLAWRTRPTPVFRLTTVGLILAFAVAWALVRLNALPAFDQLEVVRDSLAFWGTIAVAFGSVIAPVWSNEPIRFWRPRIGDIAVVCALGGLTLASVLVFTAPPVAVGAVLLVAILVLPTWRRALGGFVERVLLADVREHVALEAIEEERARIARELHDAPLQRLVGVIRRIEIVPATKGEIEELRGIAEQLRQVAITLRPPVLDDLGIAAAVEFLAESEATSDVTIKTSIDDQAGLDAHSRPPSDVELAIFRIVQEAVNNSIRHADASEILVTGSVSANRVELESYDNGRGIKDGEMRAAARRGRIGLASIRRRARAIDADVVIEGSERGTRVAVRWEA
jgi:signal transduction histidine kinase